MELTYSSEEIQSYEIYFSFWFEFIFKLFLRKLLLFWRPHLWNSHPPSFSEILLSFKNRFFWVSAFHFCSTGRSDCCCYFCFTSVIMKVCCVFSVSSLFVCFNYNAKFVKVDCWKKILFSIRSKVFLSPGQGKVTN